MPLYEYQCENCGQKFEVIEKFTDPPLTEHSKCGGKVHRLISAPALQFKGSGWYVTDYAKGSGSVPNGDNKKDGEGKKDGATRNDGKPSSSSDSHSPSSSSEGGTKSAAPTAATSDTKSNS